MMVKCSCDYSREVGIVRTFSAPGVWVELCPVDTRGTDTVFRDGGGGARCDKNKCQRIKSKEQMW